MTRTERILLWNAIFGVIAVSIATAGMGLALIRSIHARDEMLEKEAAAITAVVGALQRLEAGVKRLDQMHQVDGADAVEHPVVDFRGK